MINLLDDFAAYLYCDARLVLGSFVGLPWERDQMSLLLPYSNDTPSGAYEPAVPSSCVCFAQTSYAVSPPQVFYF